MKNRYIICSLAIFVAVSLLSACAPLVRIEDAPPTMTIAGAATAVPVATTPAAQASDPAAKSLIATSLVATLPGTKETLCSSGTIMPHASKPVVILESDEIVHVPHMLLLDLNKTLDKLLASIGQLEAPDEDILVFP